MQRDFAAAIADHQLSRLTLVGGVLRRAAQHHERHSLQHGEILQRITWHRDDVSELARLDGADVVLPACTVFEPLTVTKAGSMRTTLPVKVSVS